MRLYALVVIAAAAAAPVSEERQGALEARSLERRSCGEKYVRRYHEGAREPEEAAPR